MADQGKNPMNVLVAVLGPKQNWPLSIYNLIFNNTRYPTKEHLVQMLAFLFLNGISREVAVNVLRQTGSARNFSDVNACAAVVYHGWRTSCDFQQAFAAYYLKTKAYHTLDKKL